MGASLLNPSVFAQYAYPGALIRPASFIGLGYLAGEEWHQLFHFLHRTLIVVTLLILFMVTIAIALLLMRRTGR